jgi:glutathione S-transferase
MRLFIATPSPFARKARIALIEKGIAFETVVENPWLPGTAVPQMNPLGKVPALVLDDGTVIHDSSVIVEYLDMLDRAPRLIPEHPTLRIAHRQIEAIADGVCNAVVLIVLERARAPDRRNAEWIERQMRKVAAGVAELEQRLGGAESFTSAGFGLPRSPPVVRSVTSTCACPNCPGANRRRTLRGFLRRWRRGLPSLGRGPRYSRFPRRAERPARFES